MFQNCETAKIYEIEFVEGLLRLQFGGIINGEISDYGWYSRDTKIFYAMYIIFRYIIWIIIESKNMSKRRCI